MFDVFAVDVRDSGRDRDGYVFSLIQSTRLPFGEKEFDVVISNHVIEHVGDTQSQQDHLDEIKRVLKNDGVGYLAVPNRWQLVEPHFHLAFLSWWPESWRTRYLRLFRKHVPLRLQAIECAFRTLENQLRRAGLTFEQQVARALLALSRLKHPDPGFTATCYGSFRTLCTGCPVGCFPR